MVCLSLSTYFVYLFLYNPNVEICSTSSRSYPLSYCENLCEPPVCALYYGEDCNSASGFCRRTVRNGCQACLDSNVIAVVPGACDENNYERCPEMSNVRCDPFEDDPICVFIQEPGCRSMLVSLTARNWCEACTNSYDVLFYIKGACPEYGPGICKPQDRHPEFCTLEFSAFCTYSNDNGKITRQTASNRCEGCLGSKALFYVPGYCNPEEDPEPAIIPFELTPPEKKECIYDKNP